MGSFYGKWDIYVDYKWRLNIPAVIGRQVDNFVLLRENKEGCVRMEKPPLKVDKIKNPVSAFIIKVGRSRNNKRFLIPTALRDSTSFYYGSKITLVGKGSYLEIWPRP